VSAIHAKIKVLRDKVKGGLMVYYSDILYDVCGAIWKKNIADCQIIRLNTANFNREGLHTVLHQR